MKRPTYPNADANALMLDTITVSRAPVLDLPRDDHRAQQAHPIGRTRSRRRNDADIDAAMRDPLWAHLAGFAWAALPAAPASVTEIEMSAHASDEIGNLEAVNAALAGFEGRTYSYGGDKIIPRFLVARMRVCGITPRFDTDRILGEHVDLADFLRADTRIPAPPLRTAVAAIGLGMPEPFVPGNVLGQSWHDGYEDIIRDQLGVRMQWIMRLCFHLTHARNIAVTTRDMVRPEMC